MARIIGELPKGCRITDHISLGVISKAFPLSKVQEVLHRTGKASRRQRDLPAHVVVYYVIALALYLQVSYREVLRCLLAGQTRFQPWPERLSPVAVRLLGGMRNPRFVRHADGRLPHR